MATILDLVQQGRLLKFDPQLPPRHQEERLVYLFPRVEKRLQTVLATLESHFEGEITPEEQLDAFLANFCGGHVLEFERQFHALTHIDQGIWELKTRDLRLIGWFYRQDCFVWTNLDSKDRLLSVPGLIGGYRNEAVHDRQQLLLNDPKFVPGDRPDDVVSNFRFPPPPHGSAFR